MSPLEPITALLPADQVEELRQLAKIQDRSVSAEIRRAIQSHLDAHRAELAA